MDGLLVIDKPAGPTSHDVVARVRRAIGERRVGHTGTLDPAATGVLPLVLGKATRLAQFMSAADKSYDAVVRLGFKTDTADAEGVRVGPVYEGPFPSRDAIDRALDVFRGTFEQQPPVFSAKKIGGQPSYKLARGARPAPVEKRLPSPVSVSTSLLEIVSVEQALITLHITCSAGFYVRALAQDLGDRLGTGAHLASLRRTRSGEFTLAGAVTLDAVQADPAAAARLVIPLAGLLTNLTSVVLTAHGMRRAAHGCELGPASWEPDRGFEGSAFVRLLSWSGDLVGVARPGSAPGLLHPFVVLM